jgi:beta-lactamase superfamily II metal-dependent hydrolase
VLRKRWSSSSRSFPISISNSLSLGQSSIGRLDIGDAFRVVRGLVFRRFAFVACPHGPEAKLRLRKSALRISLVSSTGNAGPPRSDELEVSLFGPGFGESLAVHLGAGKWMIVDSCVDRATGEPAATQYLESLGVDCSKQVAVVVASHWHDDHARGLADIVARCGEAMFAYGTAFQAAEFLTLVNAPAGTFQMTSGVREFSRVLEILAERKKSGADVGHIRQVLSENNIVYRSGTSEVVALSPSSEAVTRAIQAFASQLPEPLKPHTRAVAPSPNHASVALWLQGPAGAALLGADLEAASTDSLGWGAVLALGVRSPAGLVKVPHHGSESAHDQRMWDRLLVASPEAVLTPWQRGARRLPTDADVGRLCQLAPEAAIVGRAASSPTRLEPAVERTLRGVAKSRYAVGASVGHVRARCAPGDEGRWRVELLRDASRLCAAA